ncbi:MAG: Ig-like domain-containing protein [Dysgonomonas sp.]
MIFLKRNKVLMFVILTSVLAVSCASIASPSGGDFDFDPPVVVKSTPSFNQTNVASHKIEIEFDEFVKLDQPMDKIIVTPPQKKNA